jgi:hypothetical protein
MARKQINIRAGFDLAAFSTSSQNLERSLKQTAAKMKSIGTTMSMSITAPLVAMGGLAVKTFASFEQSMAKVNAVSGATGAEFKALNQLALDLGSTTRFTSSEVSDLMLNYSKLGFSAGEIEKITQATLNLALATGEDLAKSAEVAGSTLRAFGLDASEMLRVTDVMAKSFSSSALDLDRFSESMKYVAPIAAAAGISLEETSAMLSILANNGIKGSRAGTSLRRIISDLGSTSGGTANAIDKLSKKGLGLEVAMDEVGRNAQTALIVLGKGVNQIKPLTSEFENAAGSAQAMAAIMDNTLEGAMFRMKSAIEGAAISFGEMLAPAVNKITVLVGNLATYFKNLDPETKNLIIRIAGVAAVIGPLAVAVGVLSSALAFLITPVALVVAGVGGLLFLLSGGIDTLSSTKKQVKELSESMKVLADATKKSTEQVSTETDVVKSYFDALRKTNKGSIEREQLINSINATYGTTLKNLEDETAFVKQLDGTYENLIASLKTKIKLSLKEDALADLIKIEEGINSVISVLQQRLPDQKSMGAWKEMNNELNKQYILLGDNKKAQDAILNESFFNKVAGEATKATAAIGGVTKETEKAAEKVLKLSRNWKGLGDILESMRGSKGFDPNIQLDLSGIVVDTDTSKILSDAEELGKEMGSALSSGLKALATETLISLGEFLGDSLTSKTMMNDQLKNTEEHYDNLIKAAKKNGEDIAKLEQEKADMVAKIQESFTFENRVEDFGRGLLDSIGKFMSQFGEAMIAIGIGQVMLDVAIKSFNPALAIIGGIALVAAGAAISNLSKKGISEGSSGGSSFSGGSGFSSMSGIGANMQPIVLDTRLSGRDMIITQGRESQFRR